MEGVVYSVAAMLLDVGEVVGGARQVSLSFFLCAGGGHRTDGLLGERRWRGVPDLKAG